MNGPVSRQSSIQRISGNARVVGISRLRRTAVIEGKFDCLRMTLDGCDVQTCRRTFEVTMSREHLKSLRNAKREGSMIHLFAEQAAAGGTYVVRSKGEVLAGSA